MKLEKVDINSSAIPSHEVEYKSLIAILEIDMGSNC